MRVSPRDASEELYKIRRQHGPKTSLVVSASFEFIERLRRYLPWLWQAHWSWVLEYVPHSIEWTFTIFGMQKERASTATCSIHALQELVYGEDESGVNRYRVYAGDARRGIVTVSNAYDAAKLIADTLTNQ